MRIRWTVPAADDHRASRTIYCVTTRILQNRLCGQSINVSIF